MKDRVFIYNASIILEFLKQTLMPTAFFLNSEGFKSLLPGVDIERKHLKNPDDLEKEKFTIGDLYEFYKLFRQQKDYTSEIESRYKFSIILKKLNLIKNGWKFRFRRVGRAQLVYLSPAQLRVRVPLEIRKLFPPGGMDLDKGQVEIVPEDLSDTPDDEVVSTSTATYRMAEEGDDNFTEIETDYDGEDEGFVEAQVENDVDDSDLPEEGEGY